MLHFFFAVAFSAVSLTLYIPLTHSLNLFVETVEDVQAQHVVIPSDMIKLLY
ncbi:unnamed protein product [Linum tenue]|uniref:Uncharacterized protein n=1 Tax=Linum tenue TaxID=586396 RepID=A0AAV0IER1_9ROSI|nr:unnamed protein product [Linum tenue]CAI0395793.1 unnamed protein product [Linum tenue]